MKYVILELIPTSFIDGDIVQLSAIKVDNFKVLDRFDYRLDESEIKIKDFLKIINYDKDKFIYKKSGNQILNDFKKWIQDYDLIIIDNKYTINYLKDINNNIKFINDILNMPYKDDMIDEIIEKYNLTPSNYIVDILLEALIYESNNK